MVLQGANVPRVLQIETYGMVKAARDSGVTVLSVSSGRVLKISDGEILIKDKNGNCFRYHLTKYQRSNQDTCVNQNPFVSINEKVTTGQIIADGASTEGGELSVRAEYYYCLYALGRL